VGACTREQSIFQTDHFHISIIHEKRSAVTAISPEKHESPKLRRMKIAGKAIILTKGSLFAAPHDMDALTAELVPAKGQVIVELVLR